ncbi:hypothetical protein M501DRAFT_991760 [Patellaria atrata CBS 101060]|uniref:C2H2-type domain-containing protein n=1 Tax=Patellaria atrata CBS 101060 TaxID=1346257 RepID=A0A9P4SDG8_9PEZI|nr:hypothetical protein M501DRAFT_991760 [Patellaria atrata CBS 101060]
MHSGPESMGAPSSFTARRNHASQLPNFELPPPQLSNLNKFHHFAPVNATQPSPAPPGTSASVGSLLTPPSNIPGDGLSPISSSVGSTTSSSSNQVAPYTPNSYVWSQNHQGGAPYGFQSNSSGQPFIPGRGLFSPSLNPSINSIARGPSNSPTAGEGLQGPPYELNLPPFPSSAPMSAPATLPTMSSHPPAMSHVMMNGQPPVTSSSAQPSPVHAQEAFHHRPPPTPTYYNTQQNGTPQQSNFQYSTGPSPTHPSPISAGGSLTRMSPVSAGSGHHMQPPAQSPNQYQRPFNGYHGLPGPVLSNINNPHGQMALVGGMPHGIMSGGFNSGHAASMQHMYGGHAAQQTPPNDRPFKCDQCPQSFNRNHDLKRHKRIHLAVKPFPCGHCDKSFSRKDALKRHVLVKGCGKGTTPAEGDKNDGSASPAAKSISETGDVKPMVASH